MPILISTRPRSTIVRTGGGTFGCPANGPPRHVRSWKPSATDGRVPKNMSSSRRMYSRSCGVKGQGAGVVRPVMTAILRWSRRRPNGDQTSGRIVRLCSFVEAWSEPFSRVVCLVTAPAAFFIRHQQSQAAHEAVARCHHSASASSSQGPRMNVATSIAPSSAHRTLSTCPP